MNADVPIFILAVGMIIFGVLFGTMTTLITTVLRRLLQKNDTPFGSTFMSLWMPSIFAFWIFNIVRYLFGAYIEHTILIETVSAVTAFVPLALYLMKRNSLMASVTMSLIVVFLNEGLWLGAHWINVD